MNPEYSLDISPENFKIINLTQFTTEIFLAISNRLKKKDLDNNDFEGARRDPDGKKSGGAAERKPRRRFINGTPDIQGIEKNATKNSPETPNQRLQKLREIYSPTDR
ncbi:MAG: hypothetical protein WCK31_01605 [bacterium]